MKGSDIQFTQSAVEASKRFSIFREDFRYTDRERSFLGENCEAF